MITPEELTFSLPTLADQATLENYVQEHYNNGETNICASMTLTSSPYEEWVEYIHSLAEEGSHDWGRSCVYLVSHDKKLVGMVNIRPYVCEKYANIYGHIGYGVRPSERRKGYATAILKKALLVCEEAGLKHVITSCIEENVASQNTMIRCGGQLIRKGTRCESDSVHLYFKFMLNKPSPEPELWDLYDRNKQPTGKTFVRGSGIIPEGYYHLIAHVWIKNSKGEYLISRRAATRPSYPLMFETVGGCVVKGEDSLMAAIREAKEEVGIKLSPERGKLVCSTVRDTINNQVYRNIGDNWLFLYDGDVDLNNATTDEVTSVQWMTVEEIKHLFDTQQFMPTFNYFLTDIVNT